MDDNKLTNEMMLELVSNTVKDLHFEGNFERIKTIRIESKSVGEKEFSIGVEILMQTAGEMEESASFVVKTGDDLEKLAAE